MEPPDAPQQAISAHRPSRVIASASVLESQTTHEALECLKLTLRVDDDLSSL